MVFETIFHRFFFVHLFYERPSGRLVFPPGGWCSLRAAGVPGAVEDIPTEHGRRLVFGSDFYQVEVRRLVFLFCWYIPGAVFVFLLIIWRKHGAVFVSFLIIWNKSPEAWRLVFGFC